MANVAVASTSTSNYASQSSITITKPTGLAAGDLMVAIVHKADGDVGTCSLTGWTTITAFDDSSNTGDYIFSLYKVASSADAAASNFTFTLGETKVTGGAIMRITDFNNIAIINATNTGSDSTNNTFQQYSNAITPTENGLIIQCIMLGVLGTINSAYFITNDNPSWTQIVNQTDASNRTMAIAWAYRPELTSTGTWGTTTVASAISAAFIIGIGNAPISVSDTITMVDQSQNYDITATYTDTVTETDDTDVDMTKWNNVDKNSSSWTNLNKS